MTLPGRLGGQVFGISYPEHYLSDSGEPKTSKALDPENTGPTCSTQESWLQRAETCYNFVQISKIYAPERLNLEVESLHSLQGQVSQNIYKLLRRALLGGPCVSQVLLH